MQLIISAQNLLAALQPIVTLVDRKNTIPVLSNILLQTSSEKRITLVATNLEVGMQTSAAADVQRMGDITIPAQKLLEILKALPDEATLQIDVDEKNWVHLSYFYAGKRTGTFKIAGLPAVDFPALPTIATTQQIVVETLALADCIAKTLACISHDDSRYAITGILCEAKGSLLTFVGTDGHRLSRATLQLAQQLEFEQTIIMPAAFAGIIKKIKEMCKSKDSTITLGFAERQIMASAGEMLSIARLIDAQFPDYRQIIPASSPITIQLPTSELEAVLRRVALLASDTRMVKCCFQGNTATFSAENANIGSAQEPLAIDKIGADLTIGMNVRYLLDVLQQAGESPLITMQMDEPLSPIMFFTANAEEWLSIVMPMRL